MRIHILFIIFSALLCLTRTGDMLYSFSQYRLASGLETLYRLPPTPKAEDEQQMAALQEQKHRYFQDGVESGIELLLVAGMVFCFYRVWRKVEPHDLFLFRSKKSVA